MTLTQLRYIIAIADTGSMNEAAKSLFISQPSLSLAVKELEKEIGTELFKRSNRGGNGISKLCKTGCRAISVDGITLY